MNSSKPDPTHAALILAAGSSTRLGRSKQWLEYQGESLLRRTVRLAISTEPSATIVVLAPQEMQRARQAFVDLPTRCVICPQPEEGMAASLRAGIAAIDQNVTGVLVLVCDQLALTATHLAELVRAGRDHPNHAVASAYADTLGVPAVMPRSWFPALSTLTGDQGARTLLRSHAAQVIAIRNEALAWDLDCPADLA